MEDYPSSYMNLKQSNVFNVSESSNSSRQFSSPRSRTIEELLRQKYAQNTISKENSFSLTLNTPAANLEQVLAKSRFTKRSNNSQSSSTPRFLPKEVKVSIKDLEKKIKDSAPDNSKLVPKNKQEMSTPVTKHSMDLIQKLREEVRNRIGFLEPEEPPDLFEMNVLDRNNYWLLAKQQKIEERRKQKKDRELDGCTFKPVLNTNRLRTPVSFRSKSPNSSYSMQYAKKKTFRSNSTGKMSSRSTPKITTRDSTFITPYISSQLSPSHHKIAYKSGFDMASFLSRAQPVVDYRYFK